MKGTVLLRVIYLESAGVLGKDGLGEARAKVSLHSEESWTLTPTLVRWMMATTVG
jgi:hypothetical protein